MKTRMAMVQSPGLAELVEVEVANPGETQVVIAIKASSICGSDLHIYKGKHPSAALPVSVGHELAGDVIQVGAKVTTVEVGDRVTVEPVVACGQCPPCQTGNYGYCDNLSYHYRKGQGALADYFVVDQRYVYKLPDQLSYEAGALVEPLSVAVHAVKRAKIALGDKLLIIGAGPIGILVAAVSKAAGAKEIIVADIADARLELAAAMGATRTVNSLNESVVDVVRQMTGGRGIAKTFECVGREETFVQAISCLCKGGLATMLGIFEQPTIQIPASLFVSQEITVQGSQGYCWDFETAIGLTDTIDLSKLVSHVLPLAEVDKALKVALTPSEKAVKVILKP
ncbi:L-iditol 2-dehydrogenase [Hydrogenispora ethanolica]|uniref:L-iditol 2-dehydrogenase n=1 Tax=Hydrogenispora ethanolica TaxID=1082276 RepID=A0A4R1R5R9_HYDET|nr:alcohol dehydrogenase catalytic domain-containing protein [Hydrogenispora ethanolica]TCL60873.1 L-iditol 2-dehydrogenase [Hydrogenispora ethanolica]